MTRVLAADGALISTGHWAGIRTAFTHGTDSAEHAAEGIDALGTLG